jgi:hypothetical protein
MPLATRMYLSLVLVVTALSMTFIDPAFLVVDLPRTLLRGQVWRPFTAAAFLGPPSMSWLSNIYYLVQYGEFMGAERLMEASACSHSVVVRGWVVHRR